MTATPAATTTARSPLTRLLSPLAAVAVVAAVTASPALARRKRSREAIQSENIYMFLRYNIPSGTNTIQ